MRQVLRSILVEDEELFLEDLRQKILGTGLPYQIVGRAYDGASALELLQTLKPDVVFTDIQLPGLDGLELIEQWQKLSGETHFVLISGFMDFDYARRAIRLGVEEYLTKPVAPDKLKETLQRLYEKISGSQHQRQLEYLLSQIHFSDSAVQPEQVFRNQGLQILHLTIGNHLRFGAKLPESAAEREFYTEFPWKHFFSGCFEGESWIVPTGAINERYLFFCPENNEPQERAEQLRRLFLKHYPASYITIVYDREPVDLHQIGYRAALLSGYSTRSLQAWQSGCYAGRTEPLRPNTRFAEYGRSITELVHLYRQETPEVMLKKTVRAAMYAAYLADPTQCHMELYTICLIAELQHQFPVQAQPLLMENRMAFTGLVGISVSFDAFVKSLVQALTDIYHQKKPQVKIEPVDLAKTVRQILDDSYRSSVNIAQIAKDLFVTDSYLIRIFKQKYGVSPLQYLINKRMEEAVRLLQFTDASITEVAAAVGYEDANYFNRLFKKHEGKTPTELRQLNRGR